MKTLQKLFTNEVNAFDQYWGNKLLKLKERYHCATWNNNQINGVASCTCQSGNQ